MRRFGPIAVLLLGGCTAQTELNDPGLQKAGRNFPPMIPGANIASVYGVALRSCPAPGGAVEGKGGPIVRYLGASPANADLCRIQIGNDTVESWYGVWQTGWPGADKAYPALTRLVSESTGSLEGFDVLMAPGYHYHDLIRNEGVEALSVLGKAYNALKLAHYREGFDGNIYRSIVTVWKDLGTGLIVYRTYQHIAGAPEVNTPLIPTRIAPAP